jgi:hypothetical protein
MFDLSRAVKVILAATFILAFTSVAQAQLNRSFVSAQIGNDTNTCVPTAPCRGFTKALSVTNPGGEIVVLDSGGYGSSLTIDKPVTIVAAGVYAGMAVTAGTGIIVSVGGSEKVILRGLTINGAGGSTGIYVQSAGLVYVEECVIDGFTSHGINFNAGRLFVKDTIIRNNAGNAINIFPGSGNHGAIIDHCRLEANNQGLLMQGPANLVVTVKDTVIAKNVSSGLYLNSTGFASVLNVEQSVFLENAIGLTNQGGKLNIHNSNITYNQTGLSTSGSNSKSSIKDSVISNNNVGVYADNNAAAYLMTSMIINNFIYGVQLNLGTVFTYGNNAFHGNATDSNVALSPINMR